ncbi:MAG TPA: aldo/keto reductase [Chitinophagaceae bacterium]|jgi:aryl-alcohol dehydrogenase-like predicted oxidoreductase|nr:aldo/keto reductase [Chitinophagaceae bacterium]
MNYRKFGNTDLLVSEIGFGAWAIGGGATIGKTVIGWGDADDTISEDAIRAAVEQGINFFDTADIYGLGHSEELLGKTIGNDPDSIIATKVGNVARDEQFTVDYSKQYILSACEASLRRLKRDVIDYYQLHSARLTHLKQAECIEAMQQLQEQGKIRYWGLSLNTFDPVPEAHWMMELGIGNGFQLALNMINQRALSLVKEAAFKGYGIIARMPLQFGLLTGKFDAGVSFAANDHRINRLTKEIIDASNKTLEPVWELQRLYGATKTQLALGYILSHPQVSTIIPGIRTRQQAIDNTNGLIALEEVDREMIDKMGEREMVGLMELIQKQG